MNDHSLQHIKQFFSSIGPWRGAYPNARLSYVGIADVSGRVDLVACSVNLAVVLNQRPLPLVSCGRIRAGQIDVQLSSLSPENVVEALIGDAGLHLPGHGRLSLFRDADHGISAFPPVLFQSAAARDGHRFTTVHITGGQRNQLLPQPQTDWALRAGVVPFDGLSEVFHVYGLGPFQGDLAILELAAGPAVEVSMQCAVKGNRARLGVWIAGGLDKSNAQLGYRVLDRGQVAARGTLELFHRRVDSP